ncbi:histidine phosphatase family protein [Amycolatopsis sp. K13G38]|uniref:Histidine phosphatase family protein n=1 Tax=Amycolatopsis acididurans TaxID=2724524 RepID=A0ABX1J1D9_9PSEU|nr:histidine phosphatase family protein [Amycolatopsis acididurans]NKQ53592.1 histidine phosphatase family protein [Amycolatopsis acididurans]
MLHLVRHGESEWNVAGRVQGQSARAGSLTATGRAQAARAAALLTGTRATAIVTSDLRRARDTAVLLAETLGLPVHEDPSLREQNLGELEGLKFTQGTVQGTIDGLWRHPARRPAGGESVLEMYERIHGTLARYAGRDLILVTHGGPVRVATTTADPRRGEAVPRVAVGNAAVTSLQPRPSDAPASPRCSPGSPARAATPR